MDQAQYSNIMAALDNVPDPRHARGKQLEWCFLLGIIAAALLSGHRSGAAIAQWAHEHAALLVAAFRPARRRVPSESTLRRALHQVDVTSLERHLARLPAAPPTAAAPEPGMTGCAIDGKYVRGAGMRGQPTLLVSVVAHTSTAVLGQTAVAPTAHERTAVLPLLAGRTLRGVVITLDAGLSQAEIAQQILTQGGHYLMVVKGNHGRLYDELTWFFDEPPLACDRPWRRARTVSKGHGRLETRCLTCTDDLDDFVPWPGVQQVLRRECERVVLKTGKVTRAVTYALTSLTAADASAAELAALWRGHWTIENRRHYVRDVTLGEDAHQMHVGHAPQALAAFRNGLISQLRAAGWQNIAAGLRHYTCAPRAALQFIGVPAAGL